MPRRRHCLTQFVTAPPHLLTTPTSISFGAHLRFRRLCSHFDPFISCPFVIPPPPSPCSAFFSTFLPVFGRHPPPSAPPTLPFHYFPVRRTIALFAPPSPDLCASPPLFLPLARSVFSSHPLIALPTARLPLPVCLRLRPLTFCTAPPRPTSVQLRRKKKKPSAGATGSIIPPPGLPHAARQPSAFFPRLALLQ